MRFLRRTYVLKRNVRLEEGRAFWKKPARCEASSLPSGSGDVRLEEGRTSWRGKRLYDGDRRSPFKRLPLVTRSLFPKEANLFWKKHVLRLPSASFGKLHLWRLDELVSEREHSLTLCCAILWKADRICGWWQSTIKWHTHYVFTIEDCIRCMTLDRIWHPVSSASLRYAEHKLDVYTFFEGAAAGNFDEYHPLRAPYGSANSPCLFLLRPSGTARGESNLWATWSSSTWWSWITIKKHKVRSTSTLFLRKDGLLSEA